MQLLKAFCAQVKYEFDDVYVAAWLCDLASILGANHGSIWDSFEVKASRTQTLGIDLKLLKSKKLIYYPLQIVFLDV